MTYKNIYVASYEPNRLFSLHDFTFHDFEHQFEPGTLLERGEPERYVELAEMSEKEKEKFTENGELEALLSKIIFDSCTGKIVYDVAWWAMPFNQFQYGFTTFHFEV